MSLQLAAKHLAAHGRGKDKMLVHMDKGEVDSLQKIAMANGGSLTINPHTGLPEAGFLSAMLPMIAGAGLMMIPGMQAGAAGLIVGGLKTAQSGSLSKGIMAGLGAYGGAGLAGSAGAAGAGSTTTLEGAAAPNAITPPAPVTPTAASNVMDVSGSSLPQVGGAMPQASVGQPIGSAPMTNFQDPYANAGFEGSGMPPTQPTAPPVEKMAFPGAGESYTVAPKDFNAMNASERASAMGRGASFENAGNFIADNPKTAAGAALSVAAGMKKDPVMTQPDKDMGQRYSYSPGTTNPIPAPDVPTYEGMLTKQGNYGRQQKYFTPSYTPISNTAAKELYNYADGGPVEQMSNNAVTGANTMYPMANMTTSAFATPYQDPRSTNMMSSMAPSGGGTVDQMSGEANMQGTRLAEGGEADEGFLASVARAFGKGPKKEDLGPKYTYGPEQQQYQQMASGGISDTGYNLGGYSDGGRLLRGPGDGVSDSIPAVIGKKQPARLADGEFVVPARIVSELGNGSTEAGARKLYAMMDRIQASRKNTVGKGKVAKNNRADKYLPA